MGQRGIEGLLVRCLQAASSCNAFMRAVLKQVDSVSRHVV